MKKTYSIRVDEELLKQLKLIAEQEKRSLNAQIEIILADFAETFEFHEVQKNG